MSFRMPPQMCLSLGDLILMSKQSHRRLRSSPNRSIGRTVFSIRRWNDLADFFQLSDRELQTLQCLFDDDDEAAIAHRLQISSHTVHTYLIRLYRKLGANGRCGAVVCAVRAHLQIPIANER